MDLSYGPEYEAFRAELRASSPSVAREAPRPGFGEGLLTDTKLAPWQRLLIERGYAARTIPKAYGGGGFAPDPLIAAIIAEEFRARGRAGPGLGPGHRHAGADAARARQRGAEAALDRADDARRADLVPGLLGARRRLGPREPRRTAGRVEGDTLVVNGQKIWTSTAHVAQMMFGLVRTEPEAKKHAGISYLLIPMDTPGIEVRPLRTMTGHAEFNEVFFTDVRVPLANLVGRRGEGWKIANTTLRHERDMLGSASTSEGLFHGLVKTLTRGARGRSAARSRIRSCATGWPLSRRARSRCAATPCACSRRACAASRRARPRLVTKLNGCQLNHDLAGLALDGMGEAGTLSRDSPARATAGAGCSTGCSSSA